MVVGLEITLFVFVVRKKGKERKGKERNEGRKKKGEGGKEKRIKAHVKYQIRWKRPQFSFLSLSLNFFFTP